MMEIHRMGPIGAEILGVDVKTMDDAAFGKIYQTWLDCKNLRPDRPHTVNFHHVLLLSIADPYGKAAEIQRQY